MEQTKELMDINRLANITDEEEWKAAYDEEFAKLQHVSQRSKELEYNMFAYNEHSEEQGMLEESVHSTLSNPMLLETLKRWKSHIKEPLWNRRLQVMIQEIEETLVASDPRITKIRNELQTTLMQKEFIVDGQTFNMATVNSSRMELVDRELRRKLHLAVSMYGNEVQEPFRKLIKIRNQVATEFGYRNYYDFKFQFRGLNFEQYKKECQTIIENSRDTWDNWMNRIKEKFGWDEIYASDGLYAAVNFGNIDQVQFSPDKIQKAIDDATKKFGVDLQTLPIDIKVLKIPFGGFNIQIAPDDIRMVVNEKTGHSVFFTAFHEFGHALYEAFSSTRYIELYDYKNVIAHESMAELFATITSQEKWLRGFWQLNDTEIKEITDSQHIFELILMRTHYYFSLIEQGIYENPSCDLGELSNQLFKEVYGIEDVGFHPAAELLYVSNPAYVQDYIYADGIRDMLLHKLKVDGMYGENEAFEVIKKEFMEPSERFTWAEKVKQICGEEFTFAYYGEYLASGRK
ncbi:hypothetical protein [Fredinandcohnia quinoae]|uniref:Peptidase M3A/M3B catalytic domain-containing protein n=1 Tax=Fredinandcohnia quinoae TaxID=2918902 RepID=A0AAW5E0A9_9BACI|nr:hypothetical protein [Fredinandcohnia sp. SECRCQ15]MCH1625019.1 hypothetical protein [Fredinandcohnia sp. SECRCQ15]